MEFLRDPIWQFGGVVIGLLTIVTAVTIYILQRNKKRLVYYVLTETPLLSIDDEIKGKIKIKYERRNIQNIYLMVIIIENRGNVDIASSDYEQPIIFSFPESEIINAEVINVHPKNLKPTITADLTEMIIEPILLNKGDFIKVKLLFSKFENKYSVDARIIGVKDVERIVIDKNDPKNNAKFLLVLILVMAISIISARFYTNLNLPLIAGILGVMVALTLDLIRDT